MDLHRSFTADVQTLNYYRCEVEHTGLLNLINTIDFLLNVYTVRETSGVSYG